MKNDVRFIKNENKIREEFTNMALEMNFENITIKELTERAKINRKTFYSHYSSIDDFLKEIQKEYTTEFLERVKGLDTFNDFHEITKQFYLFHEEKGVLLEKLTSDPNYDYIRYQMIKTVEDRHPNSPFFDNIDEHTFKFIINYMNEATIFIYRCWIKDKKIIPLEKIIEYNYRLVMGGINDVKNARLL